MQRVALVVALGAQGCAFVEEVAPSDLELSSMSTLYTEARGLELTHDGASGLIGMSSTTCTVDTAWGMTGSDHDVAGTDDRVDAADCGPDNAEGDCDYLVTAGERAFVVSPDAGTWGSSDGRRFRGIVGATLVDGGIAILSDRGGECLVEFAGRRTLEPRSTVTLPAEACADAAVEAGDDGALFVASDDGIYAVDEAGYDRVAEPADRLAWDAASAVLYAADDDGSKVRALEAKGDLLWREDLGGVVVAFDDAGERGGVMAMVEDGPDAGRLVLLDGVTGEVALEESTPGAARGVRMSGDGRRLAVLRDAEVVFFALEDGEDPLADELDDFSFEDLDL